MNLPVHKTPTDQYATPCVTGGCGAKAVLFRPSIQLTPWLVTHRTPQSFAAKQVPPGGADLEQHTLVDVVVRAARGYRLPGVTLDGSAAAGRRTPSFSPLPRDTKPS